MAAESTYIELADHLERQLRRVKAGTKVASEHQLASEHGVNRLTARAALQELQRRYVVRRRRGSGTFVHHRLDYVIGPDLPPSATETYARAGATATHGLIGVRTRMTTNAERDHLGLAPQSAERVTVLRRTTDVDGELVSTATVAVRTEIAPDLADTFAPTDSLHAVLRDRYDVLPTRRWSRASLETPPESVAAHLGLDARPPTWLLEGVTEDATTGRPIEFTQSWLRADLIRLVYYFERNAQHDD